MNQKEEREMFDKAIKGFQGADLHPRSYRQYLSH